MIETFGPLYLVGSLLAVGMVVADLLTVFKENVGYAISFGDKVKTIFFQILQTLVFIILALSLSWIAVGYIYMVAENR
jgi:hypothetical protein